MLRNVKPKGGQDSTEKPPHLPVAGSPPRFDIWCAKRGASRIVRVFARTDTSALCTGAGRAAGRYCRCLDECIMSTLAASNLSGPKARPPPLRPDGLGAD